MISTPLIIYGALLLAGVLGIVALVLHRVRSPQFKISPVPTHPEGNPTKRETMRTTGPVLGLGLTPSEPVTLPPEVLAATKHPRQRSCPTCSKKFHESLVLCPHDQTPLVVSDEQIQKRRVVDKRALPTCPDCSRRYESMAVYCRVDGKRLTHGGDHALSVWLCRSCGAESSHRLKRCCHSPEVEMMDPSTTSFVSPILPLMICPMCHGTTTHADGLFCSVDKTALVPVLNLKKTCIAPLGIGPRRRICEKCGLKHSKAAKFCTVDGSSLKELN